MFRALGRGFLALLAVALLATGCGGSGGAEGTYVHPEEGTITLSEGGAATWEQEGNDGPFEFEWEQDGESIAFILDGETAGEARLDEDGNLVLPPDLISGDEDVVFERQ